jgi:SdpC family antimicrobial peptide
MKKIRKYTVKYHFCTVIAMAFMFFSCSQNDNSTPINSQTTSGVKYSGEEILKGLFFFNNKISDGIPQLAELKSQIRNTDNFAEVSKSMDELSEISVNFINAKYPTFFKELETKVYSGNLYEISSVLDQAAKYIEQAGLSSVKFQAAFMMGKKINEDPNLKEQISKLDLSTSEGMNQLKLITEKISGNHKTYRGGTCTFFAAALAVAYVGVIAVSIAVGAYSVYLKVAYWGPVMKIEDPKYVTVFLNEDGTETDISREVLISQTGTFFKKK